MEKRRLAEEAQYEQERIDFEMKKQKEERERQKQIDELEAEEYDRARKERAKKAAATLKKGSKDKKDKKKKSHHHERHDERRMQLEDYNAEIDDDGDDAWEQLQGKPRESVPANPTLSHQETAFSRPQSGKTQMSSRSQRSMNKSLKKKKKRSAARIQGEYDSDETNRLEREIEL